MSDVPARPAAPALPSIDLVPSELVSLLRWVCWSYVLKDGKWTKVPKGPESGRPIGVSPKGKYGEDWEGLWTDFATAHAGALKHRLDGVGFVFAEGDGRTGIDFDACIDAQGVMRESVKPWLDHFDTYAELSPSRTGWHALCLGNLDRPGNKRPLPDDVVVKCEMYDRNRFFTFTGKRIDGHPLELKPMQPEINALHLHVFGAEDFSRPVDPTPTDVPGSAREFMKDDQIVKRLEKTQKWARAFSKEEKAEKFVAEYYKGDDSSADLALCSMIARYTANPGQVVRLWRRSILWRKKAEERADYRLSTVNKAMAAAASHLEIVDTTNRVEVTWLWGNRLPRGKLVMIDGDPGLSKSMFALRVAVSVMFNKPLIDGSKPLTTGGVILLSAEDSLADTIVPRLIAAGAPDHERIPLIHIPSTKPDDTQFNLADPADRFELERSIAQINAQLVIIDPVNAYLGDKVDSHNDQKVRQVLGPLSELANKTGCVIVCLRHLSKAGGSKAAYRGLGSIAYTAASRAAYFMAEHPTEEGVFVFACAKFNLGPKPKSIKYKLAFREVQGISKPVPYVANGEECDITANELAAAQSAEPEEGGRLYEAKTFLRQELSGGAVDQTEIEKEAKKQGIKPATLRRAKIGLKIVSVKRGKTWGWQPPVEYPKDPADDAPF